MRVLAIRRSVAWISSSTRESTDEVASSSSRIFGSESSAPRERDALALAAREREALLADHGVVAVGQPQDELVRFGRARRGLDLLARRVGPAEADVGGDRVGEEERVLEHHADVAAQRVEVNVANVDAVDRDPARVHVVEARQHQRDRRLARARAADERDRLARGNGEVEVAQHRIGRRVAERHVLEAHLAVRHLEVDRVGRVLHDGRRVEQVVDALGAGARELADGEDRRELPDRRRDQQHVGGEREERARG